MNLEGSNNSNEKIIYSQSIENANNFESDGVLSDTESPQPNFSTNNSFYSVESQDRAESTFQKIGKILSKPKIIKSVLVALVFGFVSYLTYRKSKPTK
jgi:hypothetical protein